jgi:hypothetical protein
MTGAGTIQAVSRPATAIRIRNAVVDTLRVWTKRPPPVPHSAGTLLTVAALGQLFALSQMVSYWQNYMHPFVVLGVWLALSATLPIMMFIVRRSGGVLSGWAVLPVYGMLVLTDVVVPIETRAERIGNAGWNWSAVAIFLLALAIYRPVLEVMAGSLVHSGGVFAGVALQQVQVVAPGTAVLIAAGAIIPPFAAAQFVSFYVGMLSERELAGQQAAQIEAQKASEAAVDLDGRRRLARVRAAVAPVLKHVADGAALPLDAEHAEAARRSAARLRSQLLAARDVDWLFWPATGSGGDQLLDDQVVDVRVVSDSDVRQVLDDEIKADVGSLVGLLRRHRPWERVAVTLTARKDSHLSVTVVATGDCARAAAADPAIEIAARRLSADLALVDERIVLIEGTARTM